MANGTTNSVVAAPIQLYCAQSVRINTMNQYYHNGTTVKLVTKLIQWYAHLVAITLVLCEAPEQVDPARV